MNKMQRLLKKHCPDGVEFKSLGDCIIKSTGGGTPSKSVSSYWHGNIPWASVGDLAFEDNYIKTTRKCISDEGLKHSSSHLIKKGDVIVAVKISPGKMKIADIDLAINQDLRGLSLHNFMNAEFLTYYAQTINIIGNGTIVKGISKDTLEKVKIPVPSLSVQQEIVRILDNFTQLGTELDAELEARRKQYQYYCNTLLTFKDATLYAGKQVRILAVNEIAILQYGYTAKAKDHGDYRFIRITDIMANGKLSPNNIKYVDQEKGTESCKVVCGDILVARTGTFAKTVLISEDDENAVFASFLIKIDLNRDIILPSYYWHFAQSGLYWRQANRLVRGLGGQTQFNGNVLKTVEVPIPSLEEQKRIVSILDKFDALVNGLSEGLPAEIKARRQQYEHYRDQLLSFKEIV